MPPATLDALADWLGANLNEPQPLKRPGPAAVRRLMLALEPGDLPPAVHADALFLHRSRRLDLCPPAVGVLGAHDGFDLHLTTGPNRRLALALGWRGVTEPQWEGGARGLLAVAPQSGWTDLLAALDAELGGHDTAVPGFPHHRPTEERRWAAPTRSPPSPDDGIRLALMNAMRPALLRQAAARGVGVYLTGELRPGALAAARETGLGVVALGHRRSELWGLRQLARELERAFPGLETVLS